MDATLIGVVIGVIVILFAVRGIGFYLARRTAREHYRNGMNAELSNRNAHVRVRVSGTSLTVNL